MERAMKTGLRGVLVFVIISGQSLAPALAGGSGAHARPALPAWCKSEQVIAGRQEDAPEGFFVYSLASLRERGRKLIHVNLPGLYRSGLRAFVPSVIKGTETDHEIAHVDVSDDGLWVLYSATLAPAEDPEQPMACRGRRLVLCRLDGRGRYEVPAQTEDGRSLRLSGFYRRSPYGGEVFYSRNNATILAVVCDLSKGAPRFGATRVVCAGIDWDGDDCMSISGSHIHGRLAELSRYVTIPGGGKGTAGPDQLWRFTGQSKFGCAVTLSHDGGLAVSNPTQLAAREGCPDPSRCFPIWHRGFVVLPFKEHTQPSMDIADHYFREALSANWCAKAMRPGNHDFSQWYVANDRRYVIGRQISRKPGAYGCWLVHWPDNTWTRLTPADTVALGPAAFIVAAAGVAPASQPVQSDTAASRPGLGAGQAPPGVPAGSPPGPELRRLVVRARLIGASPLPTPRTIAPYKQALVFNTYRVEAVIEGELADRRIAVAHWAIREGKLLPGAGRDEGRSYVMRLERLSTHGELERTTRIDGPDDPSLPAFCQVEEAPK